MVLGNAGDHPSTNYDVGIIIPVFNDWTPLRQLLKEIDISLASAGLRACVVIVNDGSSANESGVLRKQTYSGIPSIDVIHLISNQGHQRAIAVGIVHFATGNARAKSIVVMDGDGEDRPAHIPKLIDELDRCNCTVVIAQRTERFETPLFRLMYQVYRLVYRVLLGVPIHGGNFSAIRESALPVLAASPELWNHYHASVVRTRLRSVCVGLPRGRRFAGKTHMNYTSLIVHGLSAISASSELIGARMLIVSSALLLVLLLSASVEIGVRLWTHFVPSNMLIIGSLVAAGMTAQWILIILMFLMLILGQRKRPQFNPLRDAQSFIKSIEQIRFTND
jgi:polyisoprenyl-phosphate glycosyltransferase